MQLRALALTLAITTFSHPVFAGAPVPVDLDPISHRAATLTVVGANGLETTYSPADLETMSTYSMTTATPWRDEPAMFEGILLSELLAANGLGEVDSISVIAENDYRTVIEREIWETVDIMIATRVDGRAHSRRERGPIQFVIDQDMFNTSSLTSESNLVWMAARIEPNV